MIYGYFYNQHKWDKIGVHGVSLGGIAACNLGKSKDVDLVIADRTFGSTKSIILSFILGKFLFYLSKILFISEVDNALNFILTKCFKILLNDPYDDVIRDKISLKSQISKEIIKRIFNNSHFELNLTGIQSGNICDYAFNPDEKKIFYDDMIHISNFLKNHKDIGSDCKDEIYGKKKIINKNNSEFGSKNLCLNRGEDLGPLTKQDFSNIFYSRLKKTFENFNSCSDNLFNILNLIDKKIIEHLKDFLNNLFIYGSPKLDKEDENYYLNLHSINNVDKLLDNIINELDGLISNVVIMKYNKTSIYINVKEILGSFRNFKIFIKSLQLDEIEKEQMINEKGNLIPLNCGHICFYDDNEFDALVYLLNKNFYLKN